MNTDFIVICPVTREPCVQGCGEYHRECTSVGTVTSIIGALLPGLILLTLAVIWYYRYTGG